MQRLQVVRSSTSVTLQGTWRNPPQEIQRW
jgi:hypothetical protein